MNMSAAAACAGAINILIYPRARGARGPRPARWAAVTFGSRAAGLLRCLRAAPRTVPHFEVMASLPPALQSDQDAVVVRYRPEGVTKAPSTLEYFVLRGPAEVCRLMLEATATPYDGIMYFDGGRVGETQTPWDVRKPSSQLGYMPIYTGPELPQGMELSESGAIVRHVARLGGLAGKDPAEACQADMVFEASKSIPNIPGGWRVDDVLLGGGDLTKMQTYLSRVQKLLLANEPTGALKHFVGSGLTFGDIGMFMALQVLEETESGVLSRLGFAACVRRLATRRCARLEGNHVASASSSHQVNRAMCAVHSLWCVAS